MKRFLLLIALACGLMWTAASAAGKDKESGDEITRRSAFYEPNPFVYNTSYPRVFNELNNSVTNGAVSTGYYFIDSDDEAPDYWRPTPETVDTSFEPTLWRRILPGPRLIKGEDGTYAGYWRENPDEGLRFFRNPAYPTGGRSFFEDGDLYATDSTDDAIAGPIPIGFGFFFNGLRYDSFYVSTNGLIALSNRRYFYDSEGRKTIPAGATDAYDPMSMDWFARGGRTGDGMTDNTPDNYGYQYAALGNNPSSATSGIRARGGTLDGQYYGAAVIAPFYGDNQLSQYWSNNRISHDWGKCYFKRSFTRDKLIIYFLNIAPVSNGAQKGTPYGSFTASKDLREGETGYLAASAQVTLNYLDSSVTMVYEPFIGVVTVGGRGVPCNTVFRYNTTVGVRGYARHVNYAQSGGPTYPWGGEYEQCTHYFSNYANPQAVYPHSYLAIKFKQWKNTVRVVDIQYRVRKQDPNADLEFTQEVKSSEVNYYELLAGEDRLGAIQPVAILQNLTNNIQGPGGVNFQQQDLRFRARFRILNEATERIVYNRLVNIDSTCLALPDSMSQECTGDPNVKVRWVNVTKVGANYTASPLTFPGTARHNGIPPYSFVQVHFPPFEPNEFVDNHIGRLRAVIVSDPTDPVTAEPLSDTWPFDDTTSVELFVMRRLDNFNDDVTQYHIIGGPMPSVLKWVNIDAEVAAGDEVSHHPLAPRGEYASSNKPAYTLMSPVIRMNRLTFDRQEPATSPGGDQIRSFPVDMRLKYNAVLSMSFQRTTKNDDWPRGWCDQELVGPEPHTFVNADLLSLFGRRFAGGTYNYANAASYNTDQIVVELMQPSPDGVKYICNVPDARWRNHPRRGGVKPITNVPAYALYGSNGYFTAFLESDPDSSLAQETSTEPNGLRPDMFDDGIDYEYQKAYIPIPDTFINAEKEGAKNFRFRVRVLAYNDKKCLTCIPDEDDPFYLDNVKILVPSEITDVEVASTKIIWPYTIAPASQATAVPIQVKLSNNTSVGAPTFVVKVRIFRPGETGDDRTIYCRQITVPQLDPNTEVNIDMPSWNARINGDGEYRMYASVLIPGGDLEPLNDTTYTDFKLKFGPVFAYDPAQNPRNDVPDQAFTGLPGRGLNTYGFAYGGLGNINGPSGGYQEDVYGAGYTGGSGSGQFAMKFKLTAADTIYGYQAFFGLINQALDDISLSIYDDMGDNQPGQMKAGSLIYRQRGWDDLRNNPFFDEYVTYLLPNPLVLPAGTYWAVISQMGETGLEIGASKTRMGMRTTSVYIPPPVTFTNQVGGSGVHLMIEKNFRKRAPQGDNLINNNLFCLENTRSSGTWLQFMPTVGNPAYAHLHHYGITPADNATATLSRGTWIPMIRPYLGPRSYGKTTVYQLCLVPVEVAAFDGVVRNGGIELFWETASETNNAGFFVERRLSSEPENWNSIGYVNGAGHSTVTKHYNFFDGKVRNNTSYVYRLRQVDIDGTQSCPSQEIERTYVGSGLLALDANMPNPFTTNTKIGFNLPEPSSVKLEVIDLYGHVVKTLVNSELPAQHHLYAWEGVDESGNHVSGGTYIYRLTVGDQVLTSKMTLIK